MKALAQRPQDIADIAGIIEVQGHLDIERIDPRRARMPASRAVSSVPVPTRHTY